MPSGGSPAMPRPSNSTLPSVTGVRPAITSRSVDLPHPEGPTTAKNSPRSISTSTGPSACSGLGGRPVMNVLPTPESLTRGAATGGAPLARRLAELLQIVGEEARVDDLAG